LLARDQAAIHLRGLDANFSIIGKLMAITHEIEEHLREPTLKVSIMQSRRPNGPTRAYARAM